LFVAFGTSESKNQVVISSIPTHSSRRSMVLCKSSSGNRVEAAQGKGGVWIARGKTAARKEVEEEVKKVNSGIVW
jgi:hypothetical protein